MIPLAHARVVVGMLRALREHDDPFSQAVYRAALLLLGAVAVGMLACLYVVAWAVVA